MAFDVCSCLASLVCLCLHRVVSCLGLLWCVCLCVCASSLHEGNHSAFSSPRWLFLRLLTSLGPTPVLLAVLNLETL